jgi:uncharacterized membrane protein
MLLLPSFKVNEEPNPGSNIFPMVLLAFIIALGATNYVLKWIVSLFVPNNASIELLSTINTGINVVGFVAGVVVGWKAYRYLTRDERILDEEETGDENDPPMSER